MANSYELGTVTPYFPQVLVEKYSSELHDFGADFEDDGYIYVEDGCSDWDELANLLQRMLWEWNEDHSDLDPPRYCYIKAAYYCDKMRQDEFGGFVIFITEKSIVHDSTDAFVMECIAKQERGDLD